MSKTHRRLKHSYDAFVKTEKDMIRYFSDHYKHNTVMLNTAARQMMRSESRCGINREFVIMMKSTNWENYCTIKYDRYSNLYDFN